MTKLPNAVTLELLVQAYYTNLDRSELKHISLTCAFDWLKDHGLIHPYKKTTGTNDPFSDEYAITAKGRFFIDHVLALPLPVEEKRWVIPCE